MKTLMALTALSIAASIAPAFAQTQPVTQTECIQAGRQWDAGGKICLPPKQ
jgi:hypothetical protein